MDLSEYDMLSSFGIKTKVETLQDNKTTKTYMKVAVVFSIICCLLILGIIGYVNFHSKPNKTFPYDYKRKYNSHHKN